MLLEKTWLRVIGAALVAAVAFAWIVRGLNLHLSATHLITVAVLAGGGAFVRLRKQKANEDSPKECVKPRRYRN